MFKNENWKKSCNSSSPAREATPENNIVWLSEFIKGRLYFALLSTPHKPSCTLTEHFFTTDDEFLYTPFNKDFGPLCLSSLIRYCCLLKNKLCCPSLSRKRIIHCTSLMDPYLRANASYLISGFAVLCLDRKPSDAIAPLLQRNTQKMRLPDILPFRDASVAESSKIITLLDCLNALHFALRCGFVDPNDFNIEEYERMQKINLSWITPRGFIAFAGPLESGYGFKPEIYVDYFKRNNVQAVVRLNQPMYDRMVFTDAGIRHIDWNFPDGTPPPFSIVKNFLKLCDQVECGRWTSGNPGVIAVHCKAGLGRTGALIATRLISQYGMKAREAVAWLRICRPGSVMSLQQEWLELNENIFMAKVNYRKLRDLQCMMNGVDTNTGKPLFGIHMKSFTKTIPIEGESPPTGMGTVNENTIAREELKKNKKKLNFYDYNTKYQMQKPRVAAKSAHMKSDNREKTKRSPFTGNGYQRKLLRRRPCP